MSRRRYLSTKISQDAKINRLATKHGDFAALLYTWMIPHAEDDGTLSGDPEELLMTVMPGRRDKDVDDIEAALQAMHDIGLITWEREGDHPSVTFPDSFYNYQTYITEKRRGNTQAGNKAPSSAPDSALENESAQNTANQRAAAQNASSLKLKSSLKSSVSLEDNSPSGNVSNNLTDDAERARDERGASSSAASGFQHSQWTPAELRQVSKRIASRLKLATPDLDDLITILQQYPCAPPYLEVEAVKCAEWYGSKRRKIDIRLFDNWLTKAEQRRQQQQQQAATTLTQSGNGNEAGSNGTTERAARAAAEAALEEERARVAAEMVREQRELAAGR